MNKAQISKLLDALIAIGLRIFFDQEAIGVSRIQAKLPDACEFIFYGSLFFSKRVPI